MLNEAQLRRHETETGQTTLFGGEDRPRPAPSLVSVPAWGERERLTEEKARLGFYISGHPLDRYRELADLYAVEANTSNLANLRERDVKVACVITETSVRTSRRDGREWARLTIEDFRGTATALAFGETWAQNRDMLTDDRPVLLEGSVSGNSRDDEDPPIFIDSVQPLSKVRAGGGVGICIELREGDGLEAGRFEQARQLLEEAPGKGPLVLEWHRGSGNGTGNGTGGEQDAEPSRFASRSLRVAPTASLLSELRTLLGDRVKLVRE
jgi:DNA polymerase-3 subunit alpha